MIVTQFFYLCNWNIFEMLLFSVAILYLPVKYWRKQNLNSKSIILEEDQTFIHIFCIYKVHIIIIIIFYFFLFIYYVCSFLYPIADILRIFANIFMDTCRFISNFRFNALTKIFHTAYWQFLSIRCSTQVEKKKLKI